MMVLAVWLPADCTWQLIPIFILRAVLCCTVLNCRVLLWRELLSVTRNPADVAGRCLIFTYLAVFVGLIFCNLPTTVDALRARLNALFVEPVILLLMPYVYMSLFTSDKEYFVQGGQGHRQGEGLVMM